MTGVQYYNQLQTKKSCESVHNRVQATEDTGEKAAKKEAKQQKKKQDATSNK